jgi:hypothetical protein
MAAVALDGVVKKNLLDRTVAEKVFRPWWDTVEDYLLNVLIFLGKLESLSLDVEVFVTFFSASETNTIVCFTDLAKLNLPMVVRF